MSLSAEGILDPDELLRMLDLLAGETANDFMMSIDSRGTKVKGESERGIEFIDIGGYCHQMEVAAPPGSTKGKVRIFPLVVVRECDAATASISSLLASQEDKLEVSIFVYRASGDHMVADPFLEIVLTDARVISQAILTGGRPRQPREVTVFAGRKVEVKTAAQQHSGLRGAVRTATITASQ